LKDLVEEYQEMDYDALPEEEMKFKYREVVPNDYGLSAEEVRRRARGQSGPLVASASGARPRGIRVIL
jgi:hypothetical protein